jgi:GNAT superfamily N-acetyltransferase
VAEIGRLTVVSDHQGQRLGTRLLAAVEEQLPAAVAALRLSTGEHSAGNCAGEAMPQDGRLAARPRGVSRFQQLEWRVRGSRLAGGSFALAARNLDPGALLREAQQPAHGVGVVERLRIGPRQVLVVPVGDAERPVVRDALVGAAAGRVAGLEQVGADVLRRQVPARQ